MIGLTEDNRIKYFGKDTVFRDMFSNPKYLLQLYHALHPEDESITEADLELVILQSILLNGIYNDIRNSFNNYSEVYEDVKSVLEKFVQSKSKVAKRESQVRSFFGQHFKKKIYVDCKEEIIQIILKSETKQQVNNGLLKLYSDGTVVSHIYKTIQPLISELPGK